MNAKQKIVQAKSDLIMQDRYVFWSNLMYRLEFVEDDPPTCPYMWTDGVHIGYNPKWVEEAPMPQVKGAIVHEVSHNALGHSWRRGTRDPGDWNIAADKSINPDIITMGLDLPGDVYMPDEPGKSAEEYYGKERKKEQGKKPTCPGFPGGTGPGEVREYKGPDKEQKQAEWEIAVVNAANLHKSMNAGNLPASIKRLVDAIKDPAIDWKSALRRFFEYCARNDYDWRFPNKKFLSCGLYLPGLRSEQMPEVVLVWDTSGSLDSQEARKMIAAECAAIIGEVKPEKTTVLYQDTEIHNPQEFGPDDEIKFDPEGGGGTDFNCIFDYVQEHGLQPTCMVCITDLCGDFPDQAPDYPVIWASTNKQRAPFGETIEVRP